MRYKGWALTPQAREMVLGQFPAIMEDVRCEHVTLDLFGDDDDETLPDPAAIRVYGSLSWDGYQILAVTVDGKLTQPRKDRFFHVTISKRPGLPSSQSGIILKERVRHILPCRPFMLLTVPFNRQLGDAV